MLKNIPVKLAKDLVVDALGPLVLIGPNGSGKTRLGISMIALNKAEMVPALRDIALPPEVEMRSLSAATKALQENVQRQRQRPWQIANEIQHLFSKLMVEDSDSAVRFRDRYSSDRETTIETTSLMRLRLSWDRLFPGRRIRLEGYKPAVVSDYMATKSAYAAQQMSDGERAALYLAGGVLDSKSSILIVDEPEVHFHSKLAIRFWSEMENLRQDIKFVYITHDLPFALSRSNARFVIVMPDQMPQIVDVSDPLPRELLEALLAAASFSIFAKRIVFCEGDEERSLDWRLYSACFKGKETVLMPVGSGKEVVQCVKAFARSEFVSGVSAIGIIDRDYWPQEFLDRQPSGSSVTFGAPVWRRR
jgi:AAA domain, putative AbiEii toxin, Type IV TA system